jgi:excisionase family DNA binding protein
MAANRATPARLALTPDEAAGCLGIGRTTFYEQVLPELRVIRLGRKRLIPVRELEAWTDRAASRIV